MLTTLPLKELPFTPKVYTMLGYSLAQKVAFPHVIAYACANTGNNAVAGVFLCTTYSSS